MFGLKIFFEHDYSVAHNIFEVILVDFRLDAEFKIYKSEAFNFSFQGLNKNININIYIFVYEVGVYKASITSLVRESSESLTSFI